MMLLVLALALVASVGLVACAQEATPTPVPTPAPLQAPTVSLDGVFVADPGADVPAGLFTAMLKGLTKWEGVPDDKAAEGQTLAMIELPAVGMVIEAVFTISNPNDYMVTVDSLDYTLSVNSESVGSAVAGQVMVIKGLPDDLYIPAKGQIRVTGTKRVGAYSLIVERILQKGLSGGAAIGDTLKMWDAVKKGELTWTVTGTAQILSETGNTSVPFSFTYQ
jgi:hypothetical protein